MKNVDVPMWDKGDDTDDFSKGGASSSSFSGMGMSQTKDPEIKKLFKLILGREPSSRESAYYKYSSLKKEEIVDKLLKGEEHKNILEKSKKFPEVKEENKKLNSSILKLKTLVKDKEDEFKELGRLLEEERETIKELRMQKDNPFLSDRKLIEEQDKQYRVLDSGYTRQRGRRDETFIDRLHYLIFGDR